MSNRHGPSPTARAVDRRCVLGLPQPACARKHCAPKSDESDCLRSAAPQSRSQHITRGRRTKEQECVAGFERPGTSQQSNQERRARERGKGKGVGARVQISVDLDALCGSRHRPYESGAAQHISPVNHGFGYTPRTQFQSLLELMASLASCYKEIFFRRPPPPFDYNSTGERRSIDMDEDWLPDVKDIISGDFNVLIDLTGGSDSESDTETPSRYLDSDSGAVLATACPIRPQPFPVNNRLPRACQLSKAGNSLDAEQVEIPESLGAIQVGLAASIQHSNEEGGRGSGASAATTLAVAGCAVEGSSVEGQLEQENEEQEREETNSNSGSVASRRQPEAPIPASTIRVLEYSMISERQSPETVRDCCLRTQGASRNMSPAREVACTERRPCVSIQDITFLHVEGQRATPCGPEYQFVGKMWLRPGAGVPSDLLQVYRREVARQARLATLRTRKRTSEEADVVKEMRCSVRKKIRRAELQD